MPRRTALTGIPLLIGLLVVTFAIAADLAHEAWSTAVVQQETAERAGRDFVRLTATSRAYEAQSAIASALRALFAAIGPHDAPLHAAPGPDALEQGARRVLTCRCAPLIGASYYFRLRLSDREIRVAGDETPSPVELRWLEDTIITQAAIARGAEWDAAVLYGRPADRPRVLAFTIRTDGHRTYAYGLTSDVTAFGDAIFARVGRERPPAHAAPFDTLMRMFVLASDGQPVYDIDPRRTELRVTMVPGSGHETYVPAVAPVIPTTLYADTVRLGPQYADLRLDVALATTDPGALAGGSLPRSRYLVLLGLLLLIAGLVAVAVRQLQREHELSRLRADLTTGVSHELRTPLAQILLFGETLMFERTRSERERRAAAEVIVREARRLMHLVENALHFARVDRQLIVPSSEVIDLGTLTREILVSFAPLAWTAKVTLREIIEQPTPALVDPAAFRQILLNLLENAVRYGPAGQTVTVRVERREDVARVSVDDEGPGIPADDRERIWAPFVRLTRKGQGTLGTGIGLAVVRDLTHRYGGRAWVEHGEAGGARFVVELSAGRGVTDAGQARVGSA